MSWISRFSAISILLAVSFVFFNCGRGTDEKNTISFYVAPDGSDENSGTQDKPFKTITKARDAARNTVSEKPKKIVVRGGTYYDVEVVLSPADSGLTIEAASGETPVLYGGHPVTNWEKDGDFYAAKIEGVKERTWDFRALVVNGGLRTRARYPKTGSLAHLNKFDVRWMSTTGGGWERKPTYDELTTMKYSKGDLGPWLDVNNAELTVYHSWDESVVGLKSLDDETQTVRFSNPAGHPPGGFYRIEKATTYVVRNIREGMNEPGQWYLDRTEGKLVYRPQPGEDINMSRVIAPTIETVIGIEVGTKDITLKGLTVSCTTTPLIAGGFGAGRFPGAISGGESTKKGITNCRFINITVENAGGWAIRAFGNNNRIENCETRNIGAGGISFRGNNVTVTRNHVHDIGVIYPSAIALTGGGSENIISHNEVHRIPYSGITSGGGRGTIIENNLIYDVMRELNDGGAIYISMCKEVILRGNVVRGGIERGSGGRAYYLDEQADSCIVENNLAVNSGWPSLNHMTRGCTIRNNVFIDEGPQVLRYPRSSGVTFEKNILIADDITFNTPVKTSVPPEKTEDVPEIMKPFMNADGITAMPKNIIFSRTGEITMVELLQYSQNKTVPLEPRDGTVFADPKFVDWENGNFNFEPDSPAFELGIEPIDVSMAGRK